MASVKNVRPVLVSCVGGNSHAGLPVFLAVVPYEPECRVDRDCPPQLSCIEEHCVNVCQTRNPCAGDLECSVLDTSTGKRVVACSCPAGFVASNNAFCEQGGLAKKIKRNLYHHLCVFQSKYKLSALVMRSVPIRKYVTRGPVAMHVDLNSVAPMLFAKLKTMLLTVNVCLVLEAHLT